MRKGNFGMAAGREQNVLGGEQNSCKNWGFETKRFQQFPD
jgi:hypothetical protein